jgi:hypothetical protein
MQSVAQAKFTAGRHVDLQVNDSRFKKESLSAVMRAFMLEHEIACKQQLIDFRGWNLVIVEQILPPHRALHRLSFSGGLACAPSSPKSFCRSSNGTASTNT